MSSEADGGRVPLSQSREVTIDALMEHFANDAMDVDEFERRVDLAHRAATTDALKELVRDLPGGGDLPAVAGQGASVTGPIPDYTVTSAANVKETGVVIACLGAARRRGHWTPARTNYAVAVMGGTELDFREAALGPGITEVRVFTLFGGVEIIVPPGMHVESHGVGIMANFDHVGDAPIHPDPHAPTLRITGLSVMAGVEVSVRHQGETARDARRRRRIERRETRKRLRGG